MGRSKVRAKATSSWASNSRRRSLSTDRSMAEMLALGSCWPRYWASR